MPISGYFDIERDNEVISAGGFFCQACLVGKPLDDISPDPRYCQGCYEFLLKEAELLPLRQHPKWIPKKPQKPLNAKISLEKTIPVPQDVVLNMSPIKHEKSKVDIIQPSVAKVTREKRGPKHKPLPVELITRWASEGMGSKAIAAKLKAEHGTKVSYKTIQRILKGQRLFV